MPFLSSKKFLEKSICTSGIFALNCKAFANNAIKSLKDLFLVNEITKKEYEGHFTLRIILIFCGLQIFHAEIIANNSKSEN